MGWHGFAGEVGHQTLEAHGSLCNCGNVGCLEALASGLAIERDARAAIHAGRASKIHELVQDDPGKITGAVITQAAREGDPLARELFDRAGFYIGLGMVNLLHNFDTQLFVLGGGVAIQAWDYIYPSMSAVIGKHAMPSMRKGVTITQAQLGDDAGLLGTVALATDQAG